MQGMGEIIISDNGNQFPHDQEPLIPNFMKNGWLGPKIPLEGGGEGREIVISDNGIQFAHDKRQLMPNFIEIGRLGTKVPQGGNLNNGNQFQMIKHQLFQISLKSVNYFDKPPPHGGH